MPFSKPVFLRLQNWFCSPQPWLWVDERAEGSVCVESVLPGGFGERDLVSEGVFFR